MIASARADSTGLELLEYDLPSHPFIVSRDIRPIGGEILGAMFNPVYSHFVFVSHTNGSIYGFILNSNKTFTASISHNWPTTSWRGDVRWNF